MLVLAPDREPTLLVPTLERPDAEARRGRASLAIMDWPTARTRTPSPSALLRAATGRYGISDSAWAMHLLGLQDAAARHVATAR